MSSLGKVMTAALCVWLAGCGEGSDDRDARDERHWPINISTINDRIYETPQHGSAPAIAPLDCYDSGSFSGCYLSNICQVYGDLSVTSVYEVTRSRLRRIELVFDSTRCSGRYIVDNYLWADWNYWVSAYNPGVNVADIVVSSRYYRDGVYDGYRPVGEYVSTLWVDTSSYPSRLCMSYGVIDPLHGLRFEERARPSLDANACAKQL